MKQYFFLILIFVISVGIRLPNLNRSLSDHHEWLTAHNLLVSKILYANNGNTYHYSPIGTFSNKADKFIDNVEGLIDPSGYAYYISYPPFSFLFSHFIFSIFRISPNILVLQIINLFFHFLSALVVYKILKLLLPDNIYKYKAALLGYSIYLFQPMTLWFQSNIFSPEILAHVLWIIAVYIFIWIIKYQKKNSLFAHFLLGIILFFLSFTEWLGVLTAGVMGLYVLKDMLSKRKLNLLFIPLILAPLAALALTFFQYSSIAGPTALIQELSGKYIERGGFNSQTSSPFGYSLSNPRTYRLIINNYKVGYLYILILFSLFLCVYYTLRRGKRDWNKYEYLFIYLSSVPVILHHILFINFTAIHDFSALKSSLLISVVIGLLFIKIANLLKSLKLEYKLRQLIFISALMLFLSIRQYYNLNNPKIVNNKREIFANDIKKIAKPDEVIFVSGETGYIEPQVLFYAERNILRVNDKAEALKFLDKIQAKKGIIFETQPAWNITKIIKIDKSL